MTNYRRFERRRLLAVQVSGFHTASFPVTVKYFQVTKAKTGPAKSFRRPIAPIRVIPHPVDAAGERVARSVA